MPTQKEFLPNVFVVCVKQSEVISTVREVNDDDNLEKKVWNGDRDLAEKSFIFSQWVVSGQAVCFEKNPILNLATFTPSKWVMSF